MTKRSKFIVELLKTACVLVFGVVVLAIAGVW